MRRLIFIFVGGLACVLGAALVWEVFAGEAQVVLGEASSAALELVERARVPAAVAAAVLGLGLLATATRGSVSGRTGAWLPIVSGSQGGSDVRVSVSERAIAKAICSEARGVSGVRDCEAKPRLGADGWRVRLWLVVESSENVPNLGTATRLAVDQMLLRHTGIPLDRLDVQVDDRPSDARRLA